MRGKLYGTRGNPNGYIQDAKQTDNVTFRIDGRRYTGIPYIGNVEYVNWSLYMYKCIVTGGGN